MDTFTRRRTLLAILVSLFLFRLAFGLSSEFWYEDELQTFLLGLKFYSTGAWPYFGPDVAYPSGFQIPGALQSLLVAIPIFIVRIPEAPFILLNILSFASLCLFAWYCAKRLPEIPAWIIWGWLMTAPWMLNYSTHLVNVSYLLPGSILFFVGALETCTYTSRNLISPWLGNFMMGFSLLWVMQLHMSWVLLAPYVLVSIFSQLRTHGRKGLASLAWFALGATLTGGLLAPTFIKFGLRAGMGGTNEVIGFNAANLTKLFSTTDCIPARFLSFASFEVPRFLGPSARRMVFVRQEPWLIPVLIFVLVVGILQPITMIVLWFTKDHLQKDWPVIKYLTLGTVLLIYVSFLFAANPPVSHTFYLTFPVAMIYGFYCWSSFLTQRRWQMFAGVVLGCGLIFHVGLAVNHFSSISLYVNRDLPARAIRERDYHILGERRPESRY